jgi:hypothetical protein
MASRHLSLRIEDDTFARLEAESQRERVSRSELARTLIEEGLRMEAHPGIVFRSGPGGRRPSLIAGPDVWQVARVLRGVEARGEDVIARTVELTSLEPREVNAALRYYAEYRDEIDSWIQRIDDEADRAEAAWRREQAVLQR